MPEFEGVRVDEKFAERMEQHVNKVMDALWDGLDAVDVADMPETPSGEPWDGCATCSTREVMVLTTELVAEGFRLGLIEHTGNET